MYVEQCGRIFLGASLPKTDNTTRLYSTNWLPGVHPCLSYPYLIDITPKKGEKTIDNLDLHTGHMAVVTLSSTSCWNQSEI